MEKFFHTIGQGIVAGALFVGSLLGYHQAQNVGANVIYTPVPRYESSLAIALTATQTSTMSLVSGVDGNGQVLSGPTCFTLDSGVANSVEDLCGNASGTTVTGLLRGVDSSGYTASTTLAKAHRVGADVKITDSPILAQYYQILSGKTGFPSIVSYDSSYASSTMGSNVNNIPSVAYVNSVASSGAPNASLSAKGILQEATAAQIASGTATGSTGADLIIANRNSCITASTTPCSVIASGTLDKSFVSSTLNYGFTNQILGISVATSTATSTDSLNILPAGIVSIYAVSSTAPAGWLLADGTVYNSSTYPRLYQVLTQTYGGSSSTGTFAVPNMKGNFVAGAGGQFGGVGAIGGAATSSVSGSITTSNVGATGGPTGFAANGTYALNNGLATTTPPYIIENFIIKY